MFSKALSSFTSNITSSYTLSPQPTSSAGPWKIFDAKRKTTSKAASVFVFDPKSLTPSGGSLSISSRGGSSSLKRAYEEVLERLKREASALARLRHPCILELQEPVEETRNGGLMFVTEAVTASLASLLAEKDEQERHGGVAGRGSRYVVEEADGTRKRRELEIDELEIQKGLLQLGKGLEFLHESAGLVHGNLTPEAVMVNAKGDWKISGLAFCGPHDSATGASSMVPISLSEVLNLDPRLPKSVQMNLDYTSPDFVLDNSLAPAADMFSLGLVIIALYNSPHTSPLSTGGSLSSYKRLFNSSSSIPTQNNNFLVPRAQPLPPRLASELLPRLITRRPAQRLSAREFQEQPYFDNILVSTIRFLDALPAKTPAEKSAFLRGLPRIMPQFPKSVLEKKVLPALLEEMKDKELIASIMTNIFAMVKVLPTGKRAFSNTVAPRFREVFLAQRSAERDPAKEAGLMVLLENLEVAASNCDGKAFREDLLPILLLALESPTHGIVDAALGTLPYVLPVLDFSTIKGDLFPVIAAGFAKTNSLAIKIRGLEAFYTLIGGTAPSLDGQIDDLNGLGTPDGKKKTSATSSAILDKFTVQEKVVPLLKGIKTKEPGVMMTALKVFRQVGEVADAEFLAMDVLPTLWAMSLGPLLNLQQFQAFMTLIKSLGGRIEREQTRKLGELGASGSVAAGGAGRRVASAAGSGPGAVNGLGDGEETDFETLVTGRKPAVVGDGDLMNDWGVPSHAAARQSAGRTPSSQASQTPTFSWQSNASPQQQSQPRSQMLAPASHGMNLGRTITPDQSLSGFASLTPNSQYSMPLQPARPASSTNVTQNTMTSIPLRPQQQATTNSANGAGGIDWSPASRQQAQKPASTGWSLPPPPMSPPVTNIGNGSAFRPPPAGQAQLAAGQQKGLDQWESLL